ncbi:hypothetical protein F4553_000206 [Allocatelliglobosispora scoriae]|uniref:Uncharacterized protein n=1 Tax=Allocatelliglobosispora scoriae TaxID=643052 RepID=A0A841BCJ4_9ACTN|nr:hypothetical protein [Allocatelliglobosispora scoriae]MBB5866827.1 hypothetical protein [Allocatelliglobosispora scoriae]
MRKLLTSLTLLVLTAGCGQSAGAGPTPSPPPSFDSFLASVRAAEYSDYAGTAVAGAPEFEQMRQYLLDRYQAVRVTKTVQDGDAAVDCTAGPAASGEAGLCPAGSVPIRRTTLTDLTRFARLEDFLAKAPGGGQEPPNPSST